MTRIGTRSALLIAIGLACTVATMAQQPSPDVALRAAMELETVKGDLKGAIEQYRKIAEGADRTVAAKALVRMAECYQTLGDAQAKAVYERIVRDFRDQKEAFALAQAKLSPAVARASPTGPTTQVVRAGRNVEQISHDGRYFSSQQESNLALEEVGTGNVVPLKVLKPSGIESYPLQSTFSPDNKQLAVEWYFETDHRGRLWVVSTATNGANQPRVLYDNAEVTAIAPFDWSRDGKWIAVQVKRKDRTAQIGMVKVDDGSLHVLRSVDWIGATHMAFSPDTSLLAHDRPSGEGAIERDVFIIAIDGTREIPAVVNPGDDRLVGWSPDGRQLLFNSDRGGDVGLWSLPVQKGVPVSEAQFVHDFGNGRSMGLTDAGALYYKVLRGGADVFVAGFDGASGQLSSAPAQFIRQFNGLNQMPEWSADGRFLAYASRRDPAVVSPLAIVVSSADTGQAVREIKPKLSYLLYPRWSPDGRTFVAIGADLKGRSGIVKFDAITGEASLVVPEEVCSGLPFWSSSADGSFFCFNFAAQRIVQVDVTTAAIKNTFDHVSQGAGMSPDGRYIVHWSTKGEPDAMKLLDVTTGERRELLRTSQDTRPGFMTTVTFTPDSRHVAFGGRVGGVSGMWLVPVSGGEPRKINIDATSIAMWRFNPKTWQVAYAPSNGPSYEVRKMEHFLPHS